MIASLSGVVDEKLQNIIVIDVNGVGYGLFISNEDYVQIENGETCKLYVYEHIREQSHDLFGFLKKDNKNLFEQLLNVNGIGPKMALNLLSIGSANDVRQAIANGDVKYIQQANGVGKKAAERVVVELKDKVGLVGVDLESTGLLHSDSNSINDEAVEALIALGYSVQDAHKALHNIDTDLDVEERVKLALKGTN